MPDQLARQGRERLVKAPKHVQKLNFASLIKAAALHAHASQGHAGTGGEGKVEASRREAQEQFIWMSAMALLGILLAISVNEILWYSAVGFETVDTVFTTLLKIGVLVTTGAALYFLYKHYTARLNNLRASGVGLSEGFGFMSMYESGQGWHFVADLVTLLPMPFPFIHFDITIPDLAHEPTPTVYTSDNLLMALMFLRLQFLPRLIAEVWMMRNSMAFVSAKMNNVLIDTWFVIRALFIANFGTLVLLIFASILGASYIMLILERPYPHVEDLAEFDSALYYTIITMTTVGYGDITAMTRLGRYYSVLISFQGVVFIALIIQGVVARVDLNTTESKIIDYVVSHRNSDETRLKAAVVCQTVYRQYRQNLRDYKAGRNPRLVKTSPRVITCLRAFTSAQRDEEMASSEGLDPHTELTHKGIDQLQDRFDEMEANIQKIMRALNIKDAKSD